MFYEDIWKIIYKYTTIINFDNRRTFHCYPNKVSYEAYKYEIKRRERNFLCMVCGTDDLIYHHCYNEDDEDSYDYEEHLYDYDHNPECETELGKNTGLYCYSTTAYGESLKNLRWNICKSCKAYHNVCICNTYRNLYSHPGQFFIGFTRDKIYKNEEQYKTYDNPENSSYIQEYIVNNNIKYFPIELAEFTGSDGGMSHEWICKNPLCIEYNKIESYTDK